MLNLAYPLNIGCLIAITATELELLTCFGAEPITSEADTPWCYVDSTYRTEADGFTVIFTVHPSYIDIEFKVILDGHAIYELKTIGAEDVRVRETVQTSPGERGLKVTPDFSIDNCPKLDILLIPGGETENLNQNPKALKWIADTIGQAECVMSVCNAAFVLAKGGHLKGQSATTYFYFLEALKKAEPTCKVIHDQQFVDNGKIVTTAGLSSGLDGALHLVERYGTRFDAEQLALNIEYNWRIIEATKHKGSLLTMFSTLCTLTAMIYAVCL